jgi:hypothetical protein
MFDISKKWTRQAWSECVCRPVGRDCDNACHDGKMLELNLGVHKLACFIRECNATNKTCIQNSPCTGHFFASPYAGLATLSMHLNTMCKKYVSYCNEQMTVT